MADSDNTTALPFVTQGGRRKSCAVDDDGRGGGLTHAVHLLSPLDPCVVLLQEWEQAHHMVVVLCRLQQRLETRIRRALRSADPGGGQEMARLSEPQLSALTDHQTRWDAFDQEFGYSRARAAEAQAVEVEEEILDTVAATPAQSLPGVIAKLKVIVGGGENLGDTSSFPWPQIQSVLADLKDLSERDGHVLLCPGDGVLDDKQPGDSRGPDSETNPLRTSMSDSNAALGIHPQRR